MRIVAPVNFSNGLRIRVSGFGVLHRTLMSVMTSMGTFAYLCGFAGFFMAV
jgi:hypothetical protein